MAYEIYYTSAAEGLKRGAQGFCTVAATEGIPAALLQRLEALSGYRHHFGPGDTTGGKNPVTHAHWNISLVGKTYHVLSRISDAGFDYTHRTNSLAHHIALEAHELPPAGPAWLLSQPGIMIEQWDGRVGPITRTTPLPPVDPRPARCQAWERITGDAGWGGVLADSLVKSPIRPVCILFAPDQNILELIEESLRLLSPEQRWQATFNTYFTSMPTSVICAWRCCLAHTPAAQAAARYGAGGVVINLADPGALGELPNSAWVNVARTGVAPAAAAAKASPPAKITSRPQAARPPAAAVPEASPEPRSTPPSATEELVLAAQAIKKPAALGVAMPSLPKLPTQPKVREPAAVMGGELDALAHKHRRQMLLLYSAAVLALGGGMLALYVASHTSSRDPDIVIPPRSVRAPAESEPASVPPPPAVVVHVPVETTAPAIEPKPPPHVEIPQPIVRTPTPPPTPVAFESIIVIRTALERATSGSGLEDKTQEIDLPAMDAMRLRPTNALSLTFGGDRPTFAYHHGDLAGTLAAVPSGGSNPGLLLQWTDDGTPASAADVLELSLDKLHGKVRVTWKSSLMLRRPEIVSLSYWLLQQAHVMARQQSGKVRRVAFSPPEVQPINLLDAETALTFPSDLPPDCVLAVSGQMPTGWQATTIPNPDVHTDKDPMLQSILMAKHTHVTVLDAVFHIAVKPGWSGVTCDLAAQKQQNEASLEKFQKDVADVDAQIHQFDQDAATTLAPLKKELQDRITLQGKGPNERHQAGYPTKEALATAIDEMRQEIQTQQVALDAQKAPLASKRTDLDQLCQGYKEAAADLGDLKGFDMSVTLPDGTPITTLHFVHK